MSLAARARIVELVATTVAPEPADGSPLTGTHFVWLGKGPSAPLEEHAGRSRLYELTDDPQAEAPPKAPLTHCDTPLWIEGWLLRIRYEVEMAEAELKALIAADVRAIIKRLSVASDWTSVLVMLRTGHRRHRFDEFTGQSEHALALIAEVPMWAWFHE
jgi:hypothetical protein